MSAKPNSSPLKYKASRGFTLIEVLLAVSITAVAAIMAYQSMDSASRLAEVSQQQRNLVIKRKPIGFSQKYPILVLKLNNLATKLMRLKMNEIKLE